MIIRDRTFIISGGASGLGLSTAQDLHQHGGAVAILDVNTDAGESVVNGLGRERARFFCTDVSDTESIAAAVTASASWAKETGRQLAGVVAAAGVGLPGRIINHKNEPVPISSVDFVLNINLRGTIDLIRQTLPHLTQVEPLPPDGERGVLILVSSAAAFDGQPGQVAYAASKGALASLTLPLARDIARHGIRAVTIAPSLFESGMTSVMSDKVRRSLERTMEFPVRAGKPEEFARVVREAVENVMLNGTVIRLDGAMRMPSKM